VSRLKTIGTEGPIPHPRIGEKNRALSFAPKHALRVRRVDTARGGRARAVFNTHTRRCKPSVDRPKNAKPRAARVAAVQSDCKKLLTSSAARTVKLRLVVVLGAAQTTRALPERKVLRPQTARTATEEAVMDAMVTLRSRRRGWPTTRRVCAGMSSGTHLREPSLRASRKRPVIRRRDSLIVNRSCTCNQSAECGKWEKKGDIFSRGSPSKATTPFFARRAPHTSWRAPRDRMKVMGRKRCPHGKEKQVCKECSPCPHGKVKYQCTQCNPCPHGKLKNECVDCNPCPHGKLKRKCADCNPCPRGKEKRKCADCNPCPHGKRKDSCAACNPCPHGKLKSNCAACTPCPHGKRKSDCVACTVCPHGKRKSMCATCKTARAAPPRANMVKREPESSPEIKQEPFTIRGYFGIGDEE